MGTDGQKENISDDRPTSRMAESFDAIGRSAARLAKGVIEAGREIAAMEESEFDDGLAAMKRDLDESETLANVSGLKVEMALFFALSAKMRRDWGFRNADCMPVIAAYIAACERNDLDPESDEAWAALGDELYSRRSSK